MSINIRGKIAIVTGASRGIGEGIARVFADEGATVICAARSPDDGNRVVKSINKKGGSAEFIQTDVRLEEDCNRLVNSVVEKYGRLDILCHNAGIYPDELMEEMSVDTWDNTINTNLRSCFLLTKPCISTMRTQKIGRILFTSSITGPNVAQARLSAYSASKGGVNAFIKAASLELAKDGITVNAVSPGNVVTESMMSLYGEDGAKEIAKVIPTGELGDTNDIGYAMVYLASDQAKFVTGQALVVDGGQILPEDPDSFLRN
jgi:3-oxoacyl-[acyl-carrier protein] reductase|tara:strand:- start:59 stop:841 length:783 start_codon:yes stop_codon:yes gene_type:complete